MVVGCYTAWDVSTIPDFHGQVGQQFSIGSSDNDTNCAESVVQAARLGFHPHMAPLDILFNDAGVRPPRNTADGFSDVC